MLDQTSKGRARIVRGKAKVITTRAKAKSAKPIFDPITIEIIQSALQSVSDEMFAAMRKTAMSAIIYEVLDMGTGLTDAQGELTSSGQGIPAFVGVLDKAVKFILGKHTAPGAIEPGDVFMTNDPYHGGVTHLNDIVVAMPVFAGKDVVAWTAVIAHWNDVGGMVPGSMSTDAIEIYQEGIRLPAIKLISRGEPIASVMEILDANSRLPDYVRGDLWAAIAAVRLGGARVLELVAKYGKTVYLEATRQYMEYGEQVTRLALKHLPRGRFELAEEQDDKRVYKVAVEITPDALIIDLRDNPDQDKGPNNISYDGALVVCQMILKSLTDSGSVCNGGTFRPLKMLTKPKTIFHAEAPAALAFYYETEIRLYDLIWRCLAQSMPETMPAGHFASICGTVIGGKHPDTGRHFTIVEPEVGGWGGMEGNDGINANFSSFHGETFNCPAEISEARNGLIVDRMSLNDEGGGGGQFRGGRGVKIEYRIRSNDNFLTCGYTRSRVPPWGLAGGQTGTSNYIEVKRASGAKERYSFATGIKLDKDDVVCIVTGNGGGFGDPKQRDKASLRDDVRDGYVTAGEVERDYGGF
jgi:N-methylhydantoinase B